MRSQLQSAWPAWECAGTSEVEGPTRGRSLATWLGVWKAARDRADQVFRRLPAPTDRPATRPISLARLPPRPYDATVYRVGPLSDDWVVVELDPARDELLRITHSNAAYEVSEIATIDVYLAWDGTEAPESRVAVQVERDGPTVGILAADDSARYRSALQVAKRNMQVASTTGYLAPAEGRMPPYLLTLHPPALEAEL
jgi:hypothetical protein